MMTPTDLAQYRATYDPDAWRASLAADPSPDGRTQIIVGAALAVRALCAEVERLGAKVGLLTRQLESSEEERARLMGIPEIDGTPAPAPPAPSPLADDLAFAREVASGLAWDRNALDGAWADLPTGRAIPGDGHVTIDHHWVNVVVGGYKLRRYFVRPLTVAEARHVLHGFAQRLARSTLDYRRAAGMAILVGMGER